MLHDVLEGSLYLELFKCPIKYQLEDQILLPCNVVSRVLLYEDHLLMIFITSPTKQTFTQLPEQVLTHHPMSNLVSTHCNGCERHHTPDPLSIRVHPGQGLLAHEHVYILSYHEPLHAKLDVLDSTQSDHLFHVVDESHHQV